MPEMEVWKNVRMERWKDIRIEVWKYGSPRRTEGWDGPSRPPYISASLHAAYDCVWHVGELGDSGLDYVVFEIRLQYKLDVLHNIIATQAVTSRASSCYPAQLPRRASAETSSL